MRRNCQFRRRIITSHHPYKTSSFLTKHGLVAIVIKLENLHRHKSALLKNLCKTCFRYVKCNYCITYGKKIGKELNILLRWKNGNGIAYPAFQVKSQ